MKLQINKIGFTLTPKRLLIMIVLITLAIFMIHGGVGNPLLIPLWESLTTTEQARLTKALYVPFIIDLRPGVEHPLGVGGGIVVLFYAFTLTFHSFK